MMRERFVLLGLARARAEWFRAVGQWATAAALPAEFVRCVSIDEVRTRLGSARPYSALLVDAAVPGLDRDLLGAARAAGCAVLVVDTVDADRDWRGVGADAVLAPVFSRDELLEVLAVHARPISTAAAQARREIGEVTPRPAGRLVVVTGPGGTGASTVAIALAQGMAGRTDGGDRRRDVLLADLCRVADQAMLHDARSLVPGLQEVVEAHRIAAPPRDDLREQTFEVSERGYRLLLGLRRPRHWVTLRPRALEAALDGLVRLADVVVADIEPDLEGEAETGSLDVEDRHAAARAAVARADAVAVVGVGSMKGCYALVRTLADLLDHGVPADRVLPVINRSPRRPRQRAEVATSVAALLEAAVGSAADDLVAPVHLPTRRVDQALRDGVALPAPLPDTVANAVSAVLLRAAPASRAPATAPEPVAPGSLTGPPPDPRP